MQQVTVQEVHNTADLQECLAVRKQVFVGEQNVPEEMEVDAYDTVPDVCRHVLARNGEVAVGAGRWRPYEPAGTAKVQRVAVLAEHRGTGVGRRLMEALEASARAAGMKSVLLDAQCHAEPFYRKLGYQTLSKEPFVEAGIPHVRMEKKL